MLRVQTTLMLAAAFGLAAIAGAPVASAEPLTDGVPDPVETVGHVLGYDYVGEVKDFLAGGCLDPLYPGGNYGC